MSEIFIIPLNSANRGAFNAIAEPYIDKYKCITLTNPRSQSDVDAFIRTHGATAFKAAPPAHSEIGENYYFFSADGTIPTHVEKNTPAYQHYLAAAQKVIWATEYNGKVNVVMDPTQEVGIFYRAKPTAPWSIVRTSIIPKIDYIADLLQHPGRPDLEAQLGIYTFEKDGAKTEILTRYYKVKISEGNFATWATTMYVKNGAIVQRVNTPEDFLFDTFQDRIAYEAELAATYGTQTSHQYLPKAVSTADLGAKKNLCLPFVEHDVHFAVYKSDYTKDNRTLMGRFLRLQHGDFDTPRYEIPRDDETILDAMLKKLSDNTLFNDDKATIRTSQNITPSAKTWRERKLANVKTITQTASSDIKVEFNNGDYLLDSGNRLTLHGKAEDEYIKIMVAHAKQNWGGELTIENASAAVRAKIIDEAARQKVRVIGLPHSESSASRPAPSRSSSPAREPVFA